MRKKKWRKRRSQTTGRNVFSSTSKKELQADAIGALTGEINYNRTKKKKRKKKKRKKKWRKRRSQTTGRNVYSSTSKKELQADAIGALTGEINYNRTKKRKKKKEKRKKRERKNGEKDDLKQPDETFIHQPVRRNYKRTL